MAIEIEETKYGHSRVVTRDKFNMSTYDIH